MERVVSMWGLRVFLTGQVPAGKGRDGSRFSETKPATGRVRLRVQRGGGVVNAKPTPLPSLSEVSLLEEGPGALKSLMVLEIYFLETVTYMPESWLPHLTTLEEVRICACEQVVEFPEGIKHLKSLKGSISILLKR